MFIILYYYSIFYCITRLLYLLFHDLYLCIASVLPVVGPWSSQEASSIVFHQQQFVWAKLLSTKVLLKGFGSMKKAASIAIPNTWGMDTQEIISKTMMGNSIYYFAFLIFKYLRQNVFQYTKIQENYNVRISTVIT